MGQWLVNTSLFEQAWRAVCDGIPNWWWSSFICTAAVFFCATIYYQSMTNQRYGDGEADNQALTGTFDTHSHT